jgi:hypothetical protein
MRDAQSTWPDSWAARLRCFAACQEILNAYRAAKSETTWSQPPVKPPALLKEVAERTHFSKASVYLWWGANQPARSVRRWSRPNTETREAFVAEAKSVSFWPYRAGATAMADKFEMSLTELAAAYLRALGAWALSNPVLAACVPVGSPACVAEDMAVLAARRRTQPSAPWGDTGQVTARLTALTGTLVAAVLDDASLTPLGAFNVIRDETTQLLGDPPEPFTVKVTNAISQLADRLLHAQAGEQVLTADELRQLAAEIASQRCSPSV